MLIINVANYNTLGLICGTRIEWLAGGTHGAPHFIFCNFIYADICTRFYRDIAFGNEKN